MIMMELLLVHGPLLFVYIKLIVLPETDVTFASPNTLM